MILLNVDTMEPVHPIYLVLLTDTLLIGHPSSGGGKYRYNLSSSHSLDNLAVVNVKRSMNDLVLQLLIFPEQIYIKCENGRIKKEWFDGIEHAKRKKEQENLLVRQATIRGRARRKFNFLIPTQREWAGESHQSSIRTYWLKVEKAF